MKGVMGGILLEVTNLRQEREEFRAKLAEGHRRKRERRKERERERKSQSEESCDSFAAEAWDEDKEDEHADDAAREERPDDDDADDATQEEQTMEEPIGLELTQLELKEDDYNTERFDIMTLDGEDTTECYTCGGPYVTWTVRMPKPDGTPAFQGKCDYCVFGKGKNGKNEGKDKGKGKKETWDKGKGKDKGSKHYRGDTGSGWRRKVY